MKSSFSNIGNSLLFILIALLAIIFSFYAIILYGIGDINSTGFAKLKAGMNLDSTWRLMLVIHALSGAVALLIGWSQFISRLRESHKELHRNIGRVYYMAVIFAGLSGLYLAFYATGGTISKLGFGALSLTWLITGIISFITIMRRDIVGHERWAYRSYAITFAAVTLRIYITIAALMFGKDSFVIYYAAIAWLCWVPNLILIEIFLWRRYRA